MATRCVARFLGGHLLLLVSLAASPSLMLSQAPPTILEKLQEHHVGTSRADLLEALHSSAPEVRGLAATELAARGDREALPAIVHAAQIERDGPTRLNLASAATWMGSPEGLLLVTDLCHNRSQSSWTRVNATRTAFGREDHSCFSSLVELIQSGEAGARTEALGAASQLPHMTGEEARRTVELAGLTLEDHDAGGRLAASEALRWLSRMEGISMLRTAVAREENEAVRLKMEADLKYLVKEHPAR